MTTSNEGFVRTVGNREDDGPMHDPINARIAWCRRQRAQARTESEAEEWCAEEDGLRDALLNRNQADAYRLSATEIFRRYELGLRDGRGLLQIAEVEPIAPDVTTESTTDYSRGDT